MVAPRTWGENVRQVLVARGALFFGDVLGELRERLNRVSFRVAAGLAAACSEHLLQRHARLPIEKRHPAATRAHLINGHVWRALEAPGAAGELRQVIDGRRALNDDPDIDIDAVAAAFYATVSLCDRSPESAYWSASRFVDAAFARAAIPLAERPPYSFQRHGLAPAQLAILQPNDRAVDVSLSRFADEAADVEVQEALGLLQKATSALDDPDGLLKRLRALFSIGERYSGEPWS